MFYKREQLTHPPLIEAVFEIRTLPSVAPDLVPGAIFRTLRTDFPIDESGTGYAISPDSMTQFKVHRFLSSDRKRLVQCAPDMFTVNVLGDYGEFGAFASLINKCLSAFYDAAEPGSLSRLGIRYINLFSSEIAERVTHTLRMELSTPDDVLPKPKASATRLIYSFPEHRGSLAVATSTMHQLADGKTGQLLDLDFFFDNPNILGVDECVAWAKTAHDVIYQAFRSLITPELYAQLGPPPI